MMSFSDFESLLEWPIATFLTEELATLWATMDGWSKAWLRWSKAWLQFNKNNDESFYYLKCKLFWPCLLKESESRIIKNQNGNEESELESFKFKHYPNLTMMHVLPLPFWLMECPIFFDILTELWFNRPHLGMYSSCSYHHHCPPC